MGKCDCRAKVVNTHRSLHMCKCEAQIDLKCLKTQIGINKPAGVLWHRGVLWHCGVFWRCGMIWVRGVFWLRGCNVKAYSILHPRSGCLIGRTPDFTAGFGGMAAVYEG